MGYTDGLILAVAGPALAHITRVLAIADILRDAGLTVRIATDGAPWVPLITDQGYDVEPLSLMVDRAGLGGGSLALPASAVRAALDTDVALLRRLRPRLVLLDWRPSMRLAAALCGIPVVAIVNAQVTRHYIGPLAAPQQHPLTRIFGQRIADRLMPWLAPYFFHQWARPYQIYARAHGHAGWPDLRDYLVGDRDGDRVGTLYPDLPLLAPTIPRSGHYIGPLAHYPLPFDPLPTMRSPVLYITLGSVPATQFVDAFVSAVGDWPGSVIATRGGRGGDWPAHWISVNYADPVEMCKQVGRMAWLFHAGNGSSYQLLQSWTAAPQHCAGAVALPFHAEQQWNADHLAGLGAVRAIGSLHHLTGNVTQALTQLRETTLPLPPDFLVAELTAYAHAPQRAAEEILRWL